MNISEFCIKRPVFATVLSLLFVVIGTIGFHYLNTRFMPKFQQSSIMITTYYPGASAKLIENSITTPLENAVSGVEGIDEMESLSSQGMSSITIRLKPGFDSDQVANKIRNQVAMHNNDLPSNVKVPTVQAGWGSMDLMDIGFTSDNLSLNATRDYLERFVINRIQEIPGVSDVEINGSNKYAMRIWLNPKKMFVRGLSVEDITNAITNSNIQLPAGKIQGDTIDYPITAETQLTTAQQFGNIVIKSLNNSLIRLKDIAQINLGSDANDRSIVQVNGKPGILTTVYNGTDANPIQVADDVTHLINEIKNQLPAGMHVFTIFNQANYMKASVHEVYITIGIAILCVLFIIYLFLGRMNTVLIPIVTIPICVIATFGIIYLFGLSINVITLLAIVLSIGLVVDDAIVMLENIYRHIEKGTKPLLAATKGSREITFAIIAMTLTLAAVYAPIGLVKGQGAHIFQSFAFTLAGSVIISGFIALTLSPMMCARLLNSHVRINKGHLYYQEKFFQLLTHAYQQLLHYILKFRLMIIILALSIAAGGYFLFSSFPKAFVPQEDMGFIVTVINTPNGANVNYTEKQIQLITPMIQQYPAVKNTASISTGESQGFNMIFVLLKPYQQRQISAFKLANMINKQIQKNPELNATAFAPSFGGSMQHQLEFYIMGGNSYLDLYHTAQLLKNALKKYPGIRDIDTNLKFNSQQYQLTVDRDLAANLHVNIRSIDNTLANLLSGSTISTFELAGRNYDVYVQASDNYLHNINSINQFYVKNDNAQLIALNNLVHAKPILTQQNLTHYDRLRAAMISAQLNPGYKLGGAVKYLQTKLPKLLPSDVKYAFAGSAKVILDSNNSINLIYLLAIIFIYLVLSAQFESFLDPFIILFSVPLSVVGALLSLKMVGGSINIYTSIGLVTLIGLISKHGILITHFANYLQKRGLDFKEALIKASSIRLRPILMTTAAMICGAIPLLIATGASAHSRREIGIVIMGGLFFGTFFSLVLVPVTYYYANKFKLFINNNKLTKNI